MKNLSAKLTVILLVLLCGVLTLTGCNEQEDHTEDNALVVFNYGDYVDVDTLKMFEEETGIDVKYEEYVTPEDMYTKYKSGVIDYDLICTSDYMIEKLISEGEAQTIDTSAIENFSNIDQKYLDFCKVFDPENNYSVPFFFGTVGILYNTSMVDDEVNSWSILWNEKYKNQIIMENSMRDAFLVPLKWKGHSLNTTDTGILDDCQKLLMQQKPILEAYLVDESKDAMIAGDAAMAVLYSGDATVAMESNEDLDYCVPEEGTNIWFDSWMIPKTARHKEAAQKFIDFMCRPDIAMMNFDYIYYGSPFRSVYDEVDDETREDATIFPDEEILDKCEVYQYLGQETEDYYYRLWKELKAY